MLGFLWKRQAFISDGPEVAKAIAKVIGRSRKTVYMTSGSMAHYCYENPILKKSISKALKRGVEFQVILGNSIDLESKFVQEALKGHIFKAKKWIEPHFVVGDGKHIRIEQKHPPQTPEKSHISNFLRPNAVFLDVPKAGQVLVEYFNKLKEESNISSD